MILPNFPRDLTMLPKSFHKLNSENDGNHQRSVTELSIKQCS